MSVPLVHHVQHDRQILNKAIKKIHAISERSATGLIANKRMFRLLTVRFYEL